MNNSPETLVINGEQLHLNDLSAWRRQHPDSEMQQLADFLEEWYGSAPYIRLHTSGSTGTPKDILAERQHLRASAETTCRFFHLKEGQTALLCLPMRYIAAKMMVVRALTNGLRLRMVAPCSTPLREPETVVDFAPITPMQAARTLSEPDGLQQLNRARTILLGGGFTDPHLEEALQPARAQIYASYGMTETYSHIALRKVNGPDRSACYTPLPGVTLSLSSSGTLCITAPHLGVHNLCTNDLAELHEDGTFRILGRRDGIINSGGIKIPAEEVEQRLRAAGIPDLIVAGVPHPQLGECVALLWEGPREKEQILHAAISKLDKYHRPKICRWTEQIPRTATGKIDRARSREMLLKSSDSPGQGKEKA